MKDTDKAPLIVAAEDAKHQPAAVDVTSGDAVSLVITVGDPVPQ